MTLVVDLGHGVRIVAWELDDEGQRVGLYYEHPKPVSGEACRGGVFFDTPEAHACWRAAPASAFWELVSADQLTLSPSLLCLICGHHGFIRGGRWVPA